MIKIDLSNDSVCVEQGQQTNVHSFASPEAFKIISDLWLRLGWDNKYVYSFSWLGRPIIQLPEDMIRIQELIYRTQPDVIIETGIAHGGSLIFYASLCKVLGRGRVIGIDIEIRPHNRKALEEHPLFPYLTLIEGSSIAPSIVEQVKAAVKPSEKVLVILDSCHTKEHVAAELNAYSKLVSIDSYIVAMDGIMQQVVGAPRTRPDWDWNNPKEAALEFARNNPNFIINEPTFMFNEGSVQDRITYSPSGIIKRVK